MGKYIRDTDVQVRLKGKVRFTEDDTDENKMSIALLRRLINEAEGEVEHELSPRYMAPFQTDAGKEFANLPERPTKELLRTLCEIKATIRVLETDFGSGTVVDAEKYIKRIEDRYDKQLNKILKKKGEKESEKQGWFYPPLPGLMLNYMNEEADDGFAGMVLTTSSGDGDFPRAQINNPSQNFWNGMIDELDRDKGGL